VNSRHTTLSQVMAIAPHTGKIIRNGLVYLKEEEMLQNGIPYNFEG